MGLRFRKQSIINVCLNILLISPFFELMVFELMSKQNHYRNICDLMMKLYSISRIVITCFITIITKGSSSITGRCFFAFVLLENIVSYLNGSLYIEYFIGSTTLVGVCLLCAWLIKRSWRDYINSCIILFGGLSLVNAIQCYLMPGGFWGAKYKENAIYILGSKNTCFFVYVVFLYFLLYKEVYVNKRKFLRNNLIILFLIGATVVSDAMSACAMLLIIEGYYLVVNSGVIVNTLFDFRITIGTVILLAMFVLNETLRRVFGPILNLFGRDVSFTGRDVLWTQAAKMFEVHPIIGNGIRSEFVLATGVVADHAHSHYLDLLAKYGMIVFGIFILSVILVLNKTGKRKYKKSISALNSVILAVLLLHSIMDHLVLYNFAIVLLSIELLPKPVDIRYALATSNAEPIGLNN